MGCNTCRALKPSSSPSSYDYDSYACSTIALSAIVAELEIQSTV